MFDNNQSLIKTANTYQENYYQQSDNSHLVGRPVSLHLTPVVECLTPLQQKKFIPNKQQITQQHFKQSIQLQKTLYSSSLQRRRMGRKKIQITRIQDERNRQVKIYFLKV